MQNNKQTNSFWKRLSSGAEKFWQKLTNPHFSPVSSDAQRKLQHPSSLLLIYAVLAFIGTLAVLFVLPIFSTERAAILLAAGLILTCAALLIANLRYRDLIEQDRREELLGEKKFLDDIINGLPGIFFMYDADGRLHRWNRKHEEVLGFTNEQMSALRISDLVDSDDRATINQLPGKVELSGKSEAEINLISKSGEKIPFYITALGDTIGGRFYVLAFGIDITELRRTAEAHRVVVDHSLQGLAILRNGRIVFANRAYANTLGYSVDELYAMTPEQAAGLIFVEDRHILNFRLQAAQGGEEIAPRYETRVVCKDGSIRWVEMTMSMIDFQHQAAVQTTTVDITKRKFMEAEQARLIWELEAKNAELERFTYTVSHDLKAPLITIRGFLGFLQRDVALNNTTRLKADIQRISEATEKMQRLLSDLLMLSRIGRVAGPMEDVPFGSIVEDAAERVSGQIRAREVHVKIEGDLPSIHGDRERIVEVVQNLLDNAVKFMGEQSQPRIEIGCKGTGTDGKLTFFVKDNGIGIDRQFHQRIFGLFNKLNPDSDGTGVGLALVKRIIEIHEGRIWVESEPGSGSTFYFTLPSAEKRGRPRG